MRVRTVLVTLAAAALVAGCRTHPEKLLLFGHVYDAQTMKEYKGPLPFQVLWPKGYHCFALYSSKSDKIPGPSGSTTSFSGSGTVTESFWPPRPSVTLGCPVDGRMISVAEVYAKVLASQEAGARQVRLRRRPAWERSMPASKGKAIRYLLFVRGSVGIEVEGTASFPALRAIGLALSP